MRLQPDGRLPSIRRVAGPDGVDLIRIETEIEELGSLDPLAVYVALVKRFGHESVSLLESYAGPERDTRVSMLLIDPLVTVSLSGTRVTLTGSDAMVAALSGPLMNAGYVVSGGVVELGARKRLWNMLRAIRDAFDLGLHERTTQFSFGFFGYFGYDVAWAIEDLPIDIERSDALPDLVLSINSAHLAIDPASGNGRLVRHKVPDLFEAPAKAEILKVLGEADPVDAGEPGVPAPTAVRRTVDKQTYLRAVDTSQEHIAAGDIYQVQIGQELRIETQAQPIDVYRRLRARNPSPYMFLASAGGVTLVGASPEVCVRVDGDQVCIRPIAGTAPRGNSAQEDSELVAKLLADEKEIAEHVMLIDLARNDVARVCKPKTLDVDELMVIEQYSHVSHMVSNVIGTMRDDVDSFDALMSSFPAGTVTGAPKIRAMEIIESLEVTPRTWYGGAVGMIDFGGYVVTALTLRSTAYRDGTYHLRASAGIVADSKPQSEWQETLSKLGAPFWAVTGEEVRDAGLAD